MLWVQRVDQRAVCEDKAVHKTRSCKNQSG